MKNSIVLLFCLIALAGCKNAINNKTGGHSPEIGKHVEFLKSQNKQAKDYVLDLFKKNDLVILCERYHPENTQYELIRDIMSDPKFIENVGNVFFETGMKSITPELNAFVHSENLSDKEVEKRLLEIQRYSDYSPLWELYNFHYFIKLIYVINQSLPAEKKINVYATDVAINQDVATVSELKSFWDGDADNRDPLIAEYIINEFEQIRNSDGKRKKALVIMNYRHAYNKNFQVPNSEMIHNVGAFLFEKYPEKTANVLINSVVMQDYKWDAAFEAAKKDNIGFNFKNTPFGKDHFDMWSFTKHNDTYQDMFTGMVYYRSPKQFKMIKGVNGLIDTTFIKTYKDRVKKWKEVGDDGYPIEDVEIYKMYGTENVAPLPDSDSVSVKINKWLKK